MAKLPLKALLAAPAVQLILTSYKLAAVPDAVRARRELTHLGLQKNQLRALPDWIGELTSLTSLYVGDNPLESLPDAVGVLPALERLLLDGTALTTLPEGLSRSPMRFLHLDRMAALDWPRAFAVLAQCPRLSSLTLNANPGIAEHLDGLRSLGALRHVYLTKCELTAVPTGLAEMPWLIEVSLANNPLARVPDTLAMAPALRLLSLQKTGVTAAERRRLKALRPELRLV
jgi:leucine-rich repeat protein SHOC2